MLLRSQSSFNGLQEPIKYTSLNSSSQTLVTHAIQPCGTTVDCDKGTQLNVFGLDCVCVCV